MGPLIDKDIKENYLSAVVDSIDIKGDKKFKIVLDSGNGVAGHIAPEFFKRIGCEVIELYSDVDGNFPNHHPDPSKLENVQDLLKCVKKIMLTWV